MLKLSITASGFKLMESETMYKWFFNPAQKVLLAKPTNNDKSGANRFVVDQPYYSKLLNSCNLNADKYDYTFNGQKTDRGIEFDLSKPSTVTLDAETAKIDNFTSLM